MNPVHERAYAKLNLLLNVGRPRADGLHPLCSIFASIELHDDVHVEPAAADSVECPGVEGTNLAERAIAAFRARVPELAPLAVRIDKRIPVAAGLGGGSADAAAVLRAANRLAGDRLDAAALRDLGAELGSDVPSQIEPRHALVGGVGEIVEPIDLPPYAAVLVPQREGLSAAEVYAQFDRMGGGREQLDLDRLRELVPDMILAPVLNNDLQPAALALRPELDEVLASLRGSGALGALVSGSGPTCFGLFADRSSAHAVATGIEGALVTGLRVT